MSKWFLRFANNLLSFTVGLCLVMSAMYAGYALWDNAQIYASAENRLGDLAPSAEMTDMLETEQADTGGEGVAVPSEEKKQSSAASVAEAKDSADTTESEEVAEEEETELGSLFKRLRAVNEDIGAWITMPGTAIDYPVVRGRNNIEYVSTDIYGNFAIVGSIFLDSRNEKDYSDTYNLLYGHNMDEHRMFSDVNLYKEEKFFKENQKGYIYFPTGAHWLQSISIIVTPSSNTWIMNPQSWKEIEDEKMLELVQKDALFVSETGLKGLEAKLKAEEEVHIVALSTCSAEFTEARTILLTLMDPPESVNDNDR